MYSMRTSSQALVVIEKIVKDINKIKHFCNIDHNIIDIITLKILVRPKSIDSSFHVV